MMLLQILCIFMICFSQLSYGFNVSEPAPDTATPLAEPSSSEAEPASSVAEPSPAMAEPAPSVAEPSPSMTEPASSVDEPAPSVAEPSPSVAEPAPSVAEPSPSMVEPASSEAEPAPSMVEPAPSVAEPAPSMVEPAPSMVEPAPSMVEPSPSMVEPAPSVVEPAPETTNEPAPQTDQPTMDEPAPASNETSPSVDQSPSPHSSSTVSCESLLDRTTCSASTSCTWQQATDTCGLTTYTNCRDLCIAGPTKHCYHYKQTNFYFVFPGCVNLDFELTPDRNCLCNTTAEAVVANLPLSVTDINAKLGSTVPFVVNSFTKDSYISLAISNTPSVDPTRRAELAATVGTTLKSLYSGLSPYNLDVVFVTTNGQNYALVYLVPILNIQPTPPTAPSSPSKSPSSLSSGAIAGIVVGLTLGLILIVFIVVAVMKATEKKAQNRDVSTVYENL